jgi:Ca2+-binding RTX toxin-like protein
MSKVVKSIGYFFTGRYNAGNGNDTIHAYGFGGTINAYGGNDTIYLAGFSTTVNTGSGHDTVNAGSAHLKVNDTSGHLRVRGLSGYTEIRKTGWGDINYTGASGGVRVEHRHDGHIRMNTAAFRNVVRHYGNYGNVDFKGVGASNDIYNATRNGRIHFRGAGAHNKVKLDARHFGYVDFGGAGARNNVGAQGRHANVYFSGGGISNYVYNTAKYGDLVFRGGGAHNKVRRDGEKGVLKFAGAGLGNDVKANFSTNHSGNKLEFYGIGAANVVSLTGDRRWQQSYQTRENYRALVGYRSYRRGRRTYRVPVYQTRSRMVTKYRWMTSNDGGGNIVFGGGGGANIVTHSAKYGNIYFTGVGVANVVKLSGHSGTIQFSGGGGANVVTNTATYGDIYFTGIGAANVVTRIGARGRVQMDAVGIGNILTVGFSEDSSHNRVDFKGGGGANVITVLGGRGRTETYWTDEVFSETRTVKKVMNGREYDVQETIQKTKRVERTRNVGSNNGRVAVSFKGAGLYNVITHMAARGDVHFDGAGAANVITLTGQSGSIYFKGVGGANILTNTAKYGDIDFRGAGIGNILTLTGERGNIWFKGVGGANILTSTVAHGHVELLGGGGANVLTRTGKTGSVKLIGAGIANILTVNTTDHGKATLYGAGIGNVITATGGKTDIEMRGAGGANIVTNASSTGKTDVIAAGAGNVVTHTSDGDMRAWVAGGANIVTNTGSGHSDVIAVGKANVITMMHGGSNVLAVGQYNIITSGKGFDRVMAIGSLNIVLTSGTDAGKLDEIVTIGSLSIVDSGAGATILAGMMQDPSSALTNISGVASSAVTAEDEGGSSGNNDSAGPNLLAQARSYQASNGIGDQEGTAGASADDLASAQAVASNANAEDGADLANSAGSAATDSFAAAETAEQEAVAAQSDSGETERSMDAQLTTQANTQGTVVDTDNDGAGGALPDGVQDDPSNSFVWSILGAGFQWKKGDGVGQIVAGKLNVTFGSNGSDFLLALGRMNVVVGGAGDDWIIAGSPFGTIQTLQRIWKGDSTYQNGAFKILNKFENSAGAKALKKLNLGDEMTEKLTKRGTGFSGALALGGAGNDTIILFSQYNLAFAGSGNDVVIAFGTGNLVIKESTGALNVGLAGYANIVIHTGAGGKGASHSRLGGLMMGMYNIVYAHDGVDIHGLVMMGKGNVVLKTGQGNVKAGMLGRGNVMTAFGDGHDVVVQASLSLDVTNNRKIDDGSFFLRVGKGNSAFGQFGSLNVAMKIGDGHVTGLAVGGHSFLLNVGDGSMNYLGISLGADDNAWAWKFGDGDVRALLLGNPKSKTGRGNMADLANQALKKHSISEKTADTLGKFVGLLTAQNMLLQVGDGTFTGIGAGSNNMMIRVGVGDAHAEKSNSERVSADLEALEASGELTGSQLTKFWSKPLRIGDFDTRMLTVSIGGSNLLLDVNPDSLSDLGVNFVRERQRADDLLAHLRSVPGNERKARLTLDEFMTLRADGTEVGYSNTLMGSVTLPGWGRDQGNTPANNNPATPYDPTKPKGEYISYRGETHPAQPFEVKVNGTVTPKNKGASGGKNALVKLGNGQFVGIAIDGTTIMDTLNELKSAAGGATKAKDHENAEIAKFVHEGATPGGATSQLDRETADLLLEYENIDAMSEAKIEDLKKMGPGVETMRGYYEGGASHQLYDKLRAEAKAELEDDARDLIKRAKKEAKEEAENNPRTSEGSALDLGGNLITHIGHGNATMIAAGANNLMLKVGLGNDVMLAVGDKNIMIQMADPITTQDLVEVGHDVQIAIGTGNLIANLTGTSNDVILALNAHGVQPMVDLFVDMTSVVDPFHKLPWNKKPSGKDASGYSAPATTFAERNLPVLVSTKAYMGKMRDFVRNGGKGKAIKEKVSKSGGDFVKEVKGSFTVDAFKSVGKSLPFVQQAIAVSDGIKYVVENISESNFVIGGRGSDVIVAIGEFNIVFGDNIVDVVEFDVRSLVSAKMQSISGLPFGLGNLVPFAKADIEIKTLNGDIGDYFGGITPSVDGLPEVDPEGAAQTVKDTWANNLSTSVFTNLYVPPIGSMIMGTIGDVASGVAHMFRVALGDEELNNPDVSGNFAEIGDIFPEFANPDAEIYGGALTRVASRFDVFSIIDFDDLLEKDFTNDFRSNMQAHSYLNGDGDLIMMGGENNVAFGGFGNDVIVSLARMNLMTMGDGNDLGIVIGEDNRVSGDDGADLLLALGNANLVTGDNGNDIIISLGSYNRIRGGQGEDVLVAAGSKNLLFGEDGVDVMVGLGDKNLFYTGEGQDLVIGIGVMNYYASGGGSDVIFNLGLGSITEAGAGSDYINLAGKGNTVFGGADDDTFNTDIDTEFVMAAGGTGNDTMNTGGADNMFLGDEGDDVFVLTDDLRTGNIVGDARVGLFDPIDPTQEAYHETDVIQLDADITVGDPATVAELLNDVWFTRQGDDLFIETRATFDRSGLRQQGDILFKDYFTANDDSHSGQSGPNIEIKFEDGSVGRILTADHVETITSIAQVKTGNFEAGFFDLNNAAHQITPQGLADLAALDTAPVVYKASAVSNVTSKLGLRDDIFEVLVIDGDVDREITIENLQSPDPQRVGSDVIRIHGDVVMGNQADPSTIGELLNDVSFSKSGDDLTISSRSARNDQKNRVLGETIVKDYFLDDGQGLYGPDIEIANDNGTIGATFSANKVSELIELISTLPADQMSTLSSARDGFFANPNDQTFVSRPISEFV